MKPDERTGPLDVSPGSLEVGSLSPQQKEIARVIGRQLALLWHKQCHGDRDKMLGRPDSVVSDHEPPGYPHGDRSNDSR